MPDGPFIHKFESQNHIKYIFDVNTNQIVEVDSIAFDIISDISHLSSDDIIIKWKKKYKARDIKKTLRILYKQSKAGLFSMHRPEKMVRHYTDDYLSEVIQSNLGNLILNITERCNFRCKYCSYSGTYYYERRHSNNDMSVDVIDRAIKYYIERSRSSDDRAISFYGGEPLLAFNKIKYVKDLLKRYDPNGKYSFHMDTNGSLLNNDSILHFLSSNGFFVQISLDGPKQIHDRFRLDSFGNETFELILNNLHLIKRHMPGLYKNILFSCVLTPKSDLVELNDFFESYLFEENAIITATYVNPFDTTFLTEFIDEENHDRYAQQLKNLHDCYVKKRINNIEPTKLEKTLFDKNLINIHRRNINENLNNIPPNGTCVPSARKLFVDTDGTYRPCERVDRAFSIGNISKGVDINLINHLFDDYISLSSDDCLKCWAIRLCSECLGMTRVEKRMDIERKRKYCQMTISNVHAALVDYATILETNSKALDFIKHITIK